MTPPPAAAAAPRRAQLVSRLRVQLPAGGPQDWREPGRWRQKVEDALRCGPLAGSRRLLLLRRLRVHTSAAASQAGGAAWQARVDAACREAAARACHALDPAAAQADAVWFEDWDEAVGACLDMLLALAPARPAPAWLWPRLLGLAGLQGEEAAPALASRPAGGAPAPAAARLARALWQCWQADPAAARAGRQWLATRPQAAPWLDMPQAAPWLDMPQAAAWLDMPPAAPWLGMPQAASRSGGPRAADEAATGAALAVPGGPVQPPQAAAGVALEAARHDGAVLVPAGTSVSPPTDHGLAQRGAAPLAGPGAAAAGAAPGRVEAPAALPAADRPAARHEDPAAAAGMASRPGAAPERAAASGPLRGTQATQLAGLPLTINALDRLGFATAWRALADAAPDVATHALAGSSPWLWAWSRLPASARAQALADPMWHAMPVAEWWPAPEAGDWWARWQAAPPAVRALGRSAWQALAAAARRGQVPTPRRLLVRQGAMALSATHLDVVFRLDDADLAVRRVGLDQDPGWVPWFGRIVQLHFRPTLHGGAPQ